MTKHRSGPRRSTDAQRAVLVAAEELLAELGYQRVTMERIAERAGVGKMTLYRWWPNKAAVITDAVRESLAPVSVPSTGSVPDDVRALLRDLVGVLTRYGDASVVAGAMSSRGEAGRADLRDILQPWSDGLAEILSRAGASDSATVAHALIGYVVYRIVFLQEQIDDHDLVTLVRITVRNSTDA